MPDDKFIQYGCFGLVALIIVVAMWKGLPYIFNSHTQTITALTDSNTKAISAMTIVFGDTVNKLLAAQISERLECAVERKVMFDYMNAERGKLLDYMNLEREADRKWRHDNANRIQELFAEIMQEIKNKETE